VKTPLANTAVESALGYTFHDASLLKAALTHKSAHHSSVIRMHSFERLEFLGDRVLGLVIAEALYIKYPKEKEGDLAKRLAVLVSKESCTKVAHNLDLLSYIHAAANDITKNSHIVPDALEAILGAIYLDGGFDHAKKTILHLWQDLLSQNLTPPRDGKTTLQEWAQAHHGTVPTYTLLERAGPDHAPIFHVQVSIPNIGESTGDGVTKKEAEQNAAKNLIKKLEKNI